LGDVSIHEVISKGDLKTFIYLPAEIHKGDKSWLPPIYMDEWELFDKKKNKSFSYADTVMYLAKSNGKYVGRIMGIISHRYNSQKNESDGRFCFIESINDHHVVNALIEEVARWARAKGMTRLVGPLGFSDKDPQGLQVEGFEFSSVITTPTNNKYLAEIIDSSGFRKKVDLVSYVVDIPAEMPPLFKKILSRFENNGNFEVLEFRSTRELKPYIIDVLQLMNETFMEIYGFVPLTDKEKTELAKRYLPILDPAFIKVVKAEGRLVGFAIGMPDISEGIKRSRGKLFPVGIFQIIRSSRRTKRLVMMLGGILKEYRGQGIDVLMGARILDSAIKKGMKTIDSHLVLETNSPMRAEYERLGGTVVKRFRIYQKDL
jgi:ribosomal protein S18 acetylase RimI-like enzyme